MTNTRYRNPVICTVVLAAVAIELTFWAEVGAQADETAIFNRPWPTTENQTNGYHGSQSGNPVPLPPVIMEDDLPAGITAASVSNPSPIFAPPGSDNAGMADPTSSSAENVLFIDLATALQLTAGQNPQVAFARQRIDEAFADLRAAQVLWVPSIRAGVNYNKHEGRIQDVQGTIIETSRGSLYTGLGARAVGAGSPAVPGLLMEFRLSDAVFQPRMAARALAGSQHASRATANDMLLETSLAYIGLLEALQIEAIARETLQHALTLAELTDSFAQSGQGLQADADRARAELSLRQIELRRAEEAGRTASVRLSRLLSQDPTVVLSPVEPALVPIELVSVEMGLSELVSTGLSNRPELAESQALVSEAIERLNRERSSPLLPSVLLGLSYGSTGGGLGGDIENFGDRLDVDAAAYWEFRNFGFGERAARKQAQARLDQARSRQVQALDEVASEVAESQAKVLARREQIHLAQSGIEAARLSYERNTDRIRDGQGLPIETLQSIQALDQAQRQYVRAVADYDRAQFELNRALGWMIGR